MHEIGWRHAANRRRQEQEDSKENLFAPLDDLVTDGALLELVGTGDTVLHAGIDDTIRQSKRIHRATLLLGLCLLVGIGMVSLTASLACALDDLKQFVCAEFTLT